jgi:tetratricopeptide (TPR) repeat protein
MRLEGLGPQASLEVDYVSSALKLAENKNDDPRTAASARHYNSYVAAGDFEHALEAAEELVKLRGGVKDWYVLWVCLNELGRKGEASKAGEKALAIQPVDATDWLFNGQILALTGRKEEALGPFAKTVELNPTDAPAWTNYGIILVELNRFEEALAAIERSIRLNEGDTRPWIYRGFIMVKLRNLEEAITSYDKVIELAPNEPSGWINKTYAYCEFGKFNQALAPSAKGLELASDDYKTWANRGWVFAGTKQFEEALRHFDRAIELEPSKALLFSNRGQALTHSLKRGEVYLWTVVAIIDGKEIVSPGPAAPEMKFQVLSTRSLEQLNNLKKTRSHLALAVFYANAGLTAEAQQEFRELVRLNPKSKVTSKLLRAVSRKNSY